MTEPKKEPKVKVTKDSSTARKKTPAPKVKPTLKISKSDETTFPYNQFPVKIIHKDGKDLMDTKICYFQSEHYAQKYITRCNFKKTQYQMFVKPETK